MLLQFYAHLPISLTSLRIPICCRPLAANNGKLFLPPTAVLENLDYLDIWDYSLRMPVSDLLSAMATYTDRNVTTV